MKASTQISAVPFNNITDQSIIQNPKGIDSSNIIIQLKLRYMKILGMAYQDRKDFLIYLNHQVTMNVLNIYLCTIMI